MVNDKCRESLLTVPHYPGPSSQLSIQPTFWPQHLLSPSSQGSRGSVDRSGT